MYHFEEMEGESPDFEMVKAAPLELYVGAPDAVKSLEEPEVKSILTLFPSAVSGEHPPEEPLVLLSRDC